MRITVTDSSGNSYSVNAKGEKVADDRPTNGPKGERCDVRLNAQDKAKFLKLGGSAWLRKMLAKH